MRLFDFRCPCGKLFEDLVKSDVTTSRCSCGLDAKRVISPVDLILKVSVETSLMHMTGGLNEGRVTWHMSEGNPLSREPS